MKAKMSSKTINRIITNNIKLGLPFTVSLSNFTAKIDTPFEKYSFIKKGRGNNFFAAYNKIVKNIKPFKKSVDIDFIKYYNTGFIRDKMYFNKIYQVDITNCYPSILYNEELIDIETYNYIQTLDKKDKLAAIGMMAKRHNVFNFDNGKIISFKVESSNYSDYFFYCVQRTFEIINETKQIINEDYLFSWVDAIYFSSFDNISKIQNYLKRNFNLKSKVLELNNFSVELKKDFFHVRYIKDGKKTYMTVPTIEQSERKELMNFLLNKKHENEK
jgi:hypothetical protein